MSFDEVLRSAPVLADLDEDGVRALRANAREIRLRDGDVLYREGHVGDQLYVVSEGKLKATKESNDGRQILLAIFAPGDTFGEMALVDAGARMVTVAAVTDAALLAFDHGWLQSWLATRPRVAAALAEQVLAHRLREGAKAMADLVFLDVPGRIAKALLMLAARFGTPAPGGGIHVAHDLTQDELAQLVGASRETVNKTLADFANRGWIRLASQAMDLLDVEHLRARAGE